MRLNAAFLWQYGATVVQLYLVSRDGRPRRRLVGWRRIDVPRGSSRVVEMAIDPRLLADWSGNGWSVAAGSYAIGSDAKAMGPGATVRLPARRWSDGPLGGVEGANPKVPDPR